MAREQGYRWHVAGGKFSASAHEKTNLQFATCNLQRRKKKTGRHLATTPGLEIHSDHWSA
jgi:hypothetical protein